MTRKILPFAALAVVLTAFIAGHSVAQTDHNGHEAGVEAITDGAAAEAAYRRATATMHEAMSKMQYSGNADIDFVRGMIAHHQAAIDMAKVVIMYGEDLEIRKLAEEIVTAQEREIDQMEAWLKANAPK
jgi:uncharacterized protein (DUF305 family)